MKFSLIDNDGGAVPLLAVSKAGLAAWRLGGTSAPPHARQQPSGAGSVAAAAPPPAAQPQTRTGARPVVSAAPAFTRISAARGRSWLLVRAGGPSGTVLYEGILEQGQTMRFQLRPRLWVRMGRPSALDITLAGKAVDGLPSSPSNLLLTRTGARSA